MELIFLKDIVIVFGLAMAVISICKKLHIPSLVALLITGVLSGPQGLAIIHDASEVEPLADVGIALLLFSIGIELSMRRFLRALNQILLGGGIQVVLTLLVGTATSLFFARPLGEAIFLGCLLSLSSTAIVLSLLQERGELGTASGRLSLSILIFQDIIVVPMMLIVPLLAGSVLNTDPATFGWLFIEAIIILVFVLFGGHWIVPRLLHFIALTKDTRLFLLAVLFICFSVAWITSSLGLSFALGAFLSGLIISESEYNYHTLGNILPFQEIFTCFFFISTGMLLDGQFVLQYPFLILGCVIAIGILKATAAAIAALLMGHHLTTAIATGLTLCQVGEFSFLLVKSGIAHNISTPFHYQLFLAMTLFSMALTPLMVHLAPKIIKRLQYYGWLPSETMDRHLSKKDEKELESHVVIAGFGTSGHNLASALKGVNIPYAIIEVDPQIAHSELMKGEPIIFGDASNPQLLEYAKVQKARILTVVTNDERATRRIITIARRANPHLYIIARTRSTDAIKQLRNLGANEVIPEELEASIEVLSRVMRKCLVPKNEITKVASQLRSSEYELFREPFFPPMEFSDLNLDLSGMEIASYRIASNSSLIGTTLKEIDFRKKYNITVLAISRFGDLNWKVDPELEFSADDILLLFEEQNKIEKVESYFNQ